LAQIVPWLPGDRLPGLAGILVPAACYLAHPGCPLLHLVPDAFVTAANDRNLPLPVFPTLSGCYYGPELKSACHGTLNLLFNESID